MLSIVLSSCTQQPQQLGKLKENMVLKTETNAQNEKSESHVDIYPEVWSQNSPAGASYEFKVNCGQDYDQLETCFLWDLDSIKVIDPTGKEFSLEKDFNVNSYSGEVTRRWVLYGPQKSKLPQSGKYFFYYYKGSDVFLTQEVYYTPEIADFPKNVEWNRT